MEFIRIKCLSPDCPAMSCPSQTGYCSYHDFRRTPLGQRPSQRKESLPEQAWLRNTKPVTEMVQ